MLYIHLLGELRLYHDGRLLPLRLLPKTPALFAYLLLNRRAPVARDHLAYTLWPDTSEARARANLRRHLYNLRRTLPDAPEATPWILTSARTIQWNRRAPYWLDIAVFEQLSARLERLAEATTLYSGRLLALLDEEWLGYERGRLHALHLHNLRRLIAGHRERGEHEQALLYVGKALEDDPLQEEFVRAAIDLRHALGDRPGAVRFYETFRQQLAEEYGVPPMPETVALMERILEPQAPTAERSPRTVQLRPRGPATSPRPATNLPASLRPLIGRQAEVAALIELLCADEPAARLLTLTGAAGIGKTRLALEVASRIQRQHPERFPDGVYLVTLAPVPEAARMLPTLAATLGIPGEDSTLLETVVEELRYKRLLLVLDNFEHLLPAAPDLGDLLRAAPGLSCLVTSQAVLNLYGEYEFNVAPLALPPSDHGLDAERLAQAPAVALFCSVAREAGSRLQLTDENGPAIAAICRRLDGLPLAIELAAAQCKLLPPAQMLRQLSVRSSLLRSRARDVPARHRTLHAAAQWSYDLLEGEGQALFRRLALFADGFTPASVAAILYGRRVTDPAEIDGESLEHLAALADRNIIRRAEHAWVEGEARFSMLAVLREFAAEKVAHDPALPALKQRYIDFFDWLAEGFSHAWHGPEVALWMQRMRVERENLRVALQWALEENTESSSVEQGARIIVHLDRFWEARLSFGEAQSWAGRVLQRRSALTPETEVRLLNLLGKFTYMESGAYEESFAYHAEALTQAHHLEDTALILETLNQYGVAAIEAGAFARAKTLLQEAYRIVQSEDEVDDTMRTSILNNLATVFKDAGQPERAMPLYEECLERVRRMGAPAQLCSALANLGNTARLLGDFENDRRYLLEALEHSRGLHNRNWLLIWLSGVAERTLFLEDDERSVRLHSALQTLCQQANVAWPPRYQREFAGYIARLRRRLDEATFQRAWRTGTTLALEEAVAEAAESLAEVR